MPSSAPNQINQIVQLMMLLKPKSILDIGVGFGKYGFLAREYLELWDGRDKYDDWQRRIDGIEANTEYITDLQKMIYNNIYIGNALEIIPTLETRYDLTILIDVLEHFTPEDGARLLTAIRKKSRAFLVSTPKAVSSQGDAFNNEYERHRSQWQLESFIAPVRYNFPHPNKLIVLIPDNRLPELEKAVPFK